MKLLLRERGEKSRTKIETKERQKLGSQLAGKHAASQAKLANVNYSASCGQVFNTSRKEILFTSCLEIGRPRAVDNARTLPGHRLGQHTTSTSIRRARTENREWKYRKKAKKRFSTNKLPENSFVFQAATLTGATATAE